MQICVANEYSNTYVFVLHSYLPTLHVTILVQIYNQVSLISGYASGYVCSWRYLDLRGA